MIEGDFVQFYEPRSNIELTTAFYYICNGFGYISDQIQETWVDQRASDFFEPRHEKVYVSVWYGTQQDIALKWAKRFPKNQFVLGGPLYRANQIRHTLEVPDNVYFTSELVEEYFDIPIDLKKWQLNFPHKDIRYQYSFYTGSSCYWKKCSFCFEEGHGCIDIRKNTYDLSPLEDAPGGYISLSVPGPTPAVLRDILPQLTLLSQKDDSKYFFIYCRGGSKELEVLREIEDKIDWQHTYFCIGVEFASDRMLKKMNKGITLQEFIDILSFIRNKNGKYVCYHIANWPGIVKEDIKSVREFFKLLPPDEKRIQYIYICGPLTKKKIVEPDFKIRSNKPMKMFSTNLVIPDDKVLNDELSDVLFTYARKRVDSRKEEYRKIPLSKKDLYRKFILPLDQDNSRK